MHFLEIESAFRQILASRGLEEQEGENSTVQPTRVTSSENPSGEVSELTEHWVSGIREPNSQ
jgi:hypothetical protein